MPGLRQVGVEASALRASVPAQVIGLVPESEAVKHEPDNARR